MELQSCELELVSKRQKGTIQLQISIDESTFSVWHCKPIIKARTKMTQQSNSIGVATNQAVNSHGSGAPEAEDTSCIPKPIEKKERTHQSCGTDDASKPIQREIEFRFDPFINEIVFRGDQMRLRLIGSDFILEKYKVDSDVFLDEIIKYNWTNVSTQSEWNKMSIKVRTIIANGNPSVNPNYSSSKDIFALVRFPNATVKFRKTDVDDFEFELRYGQNAYCYGTCSRVDLDELRNSFLIVFNSINHNGKILDIQEQRQVIDPQKYYVGGDDCVVRIRTGDS